MRIRNHRRVHQHQLARVYCKFPNCWPNGVAFYQSHRPPQQWMGSFSEYIQQQLNDLGQPLCGVELNRSHLCQPATLLAPAVTLHLSSHPNYFQQRLYESLLSHSNQIQSNEQKTISVEINSNIILGWFKFVEQLTITYGTASRNFRMRLFEQTSVRRRFP